jgi:hypothetical protein
MHILLWLPLHVAHAALTLFAAFCTSEAVELMVPLTFFSTCNQQQQQQTPTQQQKQQRRTAGSDGHNLSSMGWP